MSKGIDRGTLIIIITASLIVALAVATAGAVLGVLAYTRESYSVDRVTVYRYLKSSRYEVLFNMKPNDIYERDVIDGREDLPIYLSLIRDVNISYLYSVEGAKASGTLKILVNLVHPDGWRKKYLERVMNLTDKSVDLIRMNLSDAVSLMDILCRQVGLRLTAFNITVVLNADHNVSVGSIVRRDMHSHQITFVVDVSRNRVLLDGPTSRSVPVEEVREVRMRQNIYGVDVELMRQIAVLMTSSGVVAAATLTIAKFKFVVRDPLEVFESKYRELIVSVAKVPTINESRVVYVSNPDELAKTARLLERPIIKYVDSNMRPTYFVIDRDVTYALEVDK